MARATPQSAQRYPLTLILGTDAGVRLMRELTRHGGQLSAPDIVRRTGLAKASVARGLDALEEAGVVEAAGSGRSMLYRLRPDHPLTSAVRRLFEAEEVRFRAILDSIRSAAEAAGPGIIALWLFGSVARGEDRAGSDLDLALVAHPSALPALADAFRDGLVAPADTMGFRPSVIALTADEILKLAAERDPWWTSAIRSAIPLIGERPNDLVSRLSPGPGPAVVA